MISLNNKRCWKSKRTYDLGNEINNEIEELRQCMEEDINNYLIINKLDNVVIRKEDGVKGKFKTSRITHDRMPEIKFYKYKKNGELGGIGNCVFDWNELTEYFEQA